MTDRQQWATYADASALLHVPATTLRVWVHRGNKGQGRRIETTFIRGRVHVSLADARRAEKDAREREMA